MPRAFLVHYKKRRAQAYRQQEESYHNDKTMSTYRTSGDTQLAIHENSSPNADVSEEISIAEVGLPKVADTPNKEPEYTAQANCYDDDNDDNDDDEDEEEDIDVLSVEDEDDISTLTPERTSEENFRMKTFTMETPSNCNSASPDLLLTGNREGPMVARDDTAPISPVQFIRSHEHPVNEIRRQNMSSSFELAEDSVDPVEALQIKESKFPIHHEPDYRHKIMHYLQHPIRNNIDYWHYLQKAHANDHHQRQSFMLERHRVDTFNTTPSVPIHYNNRMMSNKPWEFAQAQDCKYNIDYMPCIPRLNANNLITNDLSHRYQHKVSESIPVERHIVQKDISPYSDVMSGTRYPIIPTSGEQHRMKHVDESAKSYVSDLQKSVGLNIKRLPFRVHRRHHDPCKTKSLKKYKCDLCPKAFSRSNTLVTHRRIHTGEKPFKCELCGRAFRQPGNLTRHRLTHTTLKPYVCSVCSKAFNRTSNLHTHLRTHADVTSLPCPYCNKTLYEDASNLGDLPSSCTGCGHRLALFDRERHLTTNGNNKVASLA